MATLELSIDEDVAVSPVKRTRRLGPLFWAAIGWMIFVFAAAALAEPAAAAQSDRHGHAGAPRAGLGCCTGSAPTASGATNWPG